MMNEKEFAKSGGTFELCVVQHVDMAYFSVREKTMLEYDKTAVRVSDFQTVTFTPLPVEVVTTNAVAAINLQISKVQAEAGRQIAELEERRDQMLAITHQSESVDG